MPRRCGRQVVTCGLTSRGLLQPETIQNQVHVGDGGALRAPNAGCISCHVVSALTSYTERCRVSPPSYIDRILIVGRSLAEVDSSVVSTNQGVTFARGLLIFAGVYALAGAIYLGYWVILWQSRGTEGSYSPSTSGWGVVAVWFLAGVALVFCAMLVTASPRSIGFVSIAIASLGFVGVLAFGPIHVTTSNGVKFFEVARLPVWSPVAAWCGCTVLAMAGGVVCLRMHRRAETRPTSAST
jgi:hypothetical protein